MSAAPAPGREVVRGLLDADGHLLQADSALADLHTASGGRAGGMLAVPQVAALARLARRLGIPISRMAIASDDSHDIELWVRAEPQGERTSLAITGWTRLPSHTPCRDRDADFTRARADWSWRTDDGLRLTAIAAEGADAAGKSPADLLGKPLTSLFRFREDQDGALPILVALAERRRFDDQLGELRTDSRQLYRLSGFPLIDADGRFAGFSGSAALEHVPDQAPDQMLRAPLDRIIAQADTIGDAGEGLLSDQYAGYAADIASAGRHLLSLVDDLGDLAAVEGDAVRTAQEPIDLALIARQAATMLAVRAGERRVQLAAPAADLTLPAIGDHRRAFQILVNLIGNAIRYSPEGGTVEIAGAHDEGNVRIAVTDRGRGIDPADQQRVFDKFERVDPTEPGGTGLGLYIARGLARAMGGDIALVSAPGLGARFTLSLPERR